ncbi:MAG: DNA mismatch repair protein MutS, partial [Verrucomicrobiota bacterium]
YELFFEDAKVATDILSLALTKRNGIPMCGVPHHAAEGYIGKLIDAGKRVAVAEQTTAPVPGKIVKREISQVISAGTVNDLNLLEATRNNYLAGICSLPRNRFGLAYLDLTTGDFRLTECASRASLLDELRAVQPAEILYSDEQEGEFGGVPGAISYDGYAFLEDQAVHLLKEHFRVQSLDGFGCGSLPAAVGAAGALMHYLKHQLRRDPSHIRRIRTYRTESFVLIDEASRENLDLVTSRAGKKHTLLHALDRSSTPMGARKLRHWILHPLRDQAAILARQTLIAQFLGNTIVLNELRSGFDQVRDIERTLARLSQGAGNARDLLALARSLDQIPSLRKKLEEADPDKASETTVSLIPALRDFSGISATITAALVKEPPATIKEGGLFQDGYDKELDEIRSASREGKGWIADLQTREIERTGIKSLKVKFNNVFGYYIEVTKSNLAQVPDDYHRKQTTANAERFITPELKEMENKVLGADERSRTFEYEAFLKLRESMLEELEAMQAAADALATLDVLSGLAETARLYGYCRPSLNTSGLLRLTEARHPVLDQNVAEEKFVPNDTHLDAGENRLVILTGPNMAGKSTYIRQVALITLMAQIGSFVPAAEAEVGLVDRIFTRVGANDDL